MINRKIIYDAPQEQFFIDVRSNKLVDIMTRNFQAVSGMHVAESESASWSVSGDKIKNLVESSGLSDVYISFEYQVPYTQKRIDCLLFGKNNEGHGIVVHIEMKQWEKVTALNIEGNFVETIIGGGTKIVPHPSQQVEGYHDYMFGFIQVFEQKELDLIGCSYCPNYRKNIGEGLFNPIYYTILEKYPIYTHEEVDLLAKRLRELLVKGDGFEIFNKFMSSPVKPSKKLLESASKIVSNSSDFTLLNDQIIAKNAILHMIRKAEKNNEKNVVIVKGGPGTGKTVIALHILAEMAAKKKIVFFSSKSKPLIEAIRDKINHNTAKLLFTNLNPYVPSRMKENQIDVLIIDEAHRIQKSSNSQWTKPGDRTDMPQIDQLIRSAKTSIFFIDDKQVIRYLEVGNTDLIKEAAQKIYCPIEEIELVSQFRCAGSENYLDWLEYVLGHSKQRIMFNPTKENFDFRIIDSPEKLYELIQQKNSEPGKTARLTAGYCWEWSKELDQNGELIKDVRIGNFAMPWETHDNVVPPKGYVRWYEWAYKPEGIKQVGCIYTAQGFEFDYIGVIIGPDLKYDRSHDCLVGNPQGTKDPVLRRQKEGLEDYVKNIYRVLLSRGLKGCYVYFIDKEIEQFFKLKMVNSKN